MLQDDNVKSGDGQSLQVLADTGYFPDIHATWAQSHTLSELSKNSHGLLQIAAIVLGQTHLRCVLSYFAFPAHSTIGS